MSESYLRARPSQEATEVPAMEIITNPDGTKIARVDLRRLPSDLAEDRNLKEDMRDQVRQRVGDGKVQIGSIGWAISGEPTPESRRALRVSLNAMNIAKQANPDRWHDFGPTALGLNEHGPSALVVSTRPGSAYYHHWEVDQYAGELAQAARDQLEQHDIPFSL